MLLIAMVLLSSEAVSRRQTGSQAEFTIFIDRFGSTFVNNKQYSTEQILQVITQNQKAIKKIIILYAPFSLEFDRVNLAGMLKSKFPQVKIELKKAKRGDFPEQILHKSDNHLIGKLLAERNKILQMMTFRHKEIVAHLQQYVSRLRKEIAQANLKLSVWNKEIMPQHK